MQTVLQELIQWCTENAFNIEGQDGTKYLAIDYEDMRQLFDSLLAKERQQIIDAYTVGQQGIIEVLGNELSHRGVAYTLGIADDDKEDGELYYSGTFEKDK